MTAPWVKLRTDLVTSPQVLAVSPAAFQLHIAALCWCGEHETDGAIPRRAAGVLLCASDTTIGELVDNGLWEAAEAGWVIAGWLEDQTSHADRTAARQAAADRKAKWRDQQKQQPTRPATRSERVAERDGNASRTRHVTPSELEVEITTTPPTPPRPGYPQDGAGGDRVPVTPNGEPAPDPHHAVAQAAALIALTKRRDQGETIRNPAGWLRWYAADTLTNHWAEIDDHLNAGATVDSAARALNGQQPGPPALQPWHPDQTPPDPARNLAGISTARTSIRTTTP